MVVVGCSLDEAYGILNKKRDKKDKKKSRRSFNVNGYEDTQKEYSPVSRIGHVEMKDEMPKLPFMVFDKEDHSNDEDKEEDNKESGNKRPDNKEQKLEVVKPEVVPQPKNKDENVHPYNINYNDIINYLIHKRNTTEGFTNQTNNFKNVNDGFNDVLLFALFGIFFLVFTDYIYKLGKKSY